MAQFPSLTGVYLEDEAVCDFVLGFLGSHCPEIRSLALTGSPRDLSGPGLEAFFKTLKGVRELEFGLFGILLPDSVSCLHKLETLIVNNAPESFPEALGALSSLTELKLAYEAGCWHITIPESVFLLPMLHTLHLSGTSTTSLRRLASSQPFVS